jgi:hypothetical protein
VALLLFEQRIVERVGGDQDLAGQALHRAHHMLVAHGQVMMDDIAYIALDGQDADLRRDVEAGVLAIGQSLGACRNGDISLPSSQRCSSACGPRLADDPMLPRRARAASRSPKVRAC